MMKHATLAQGDLIMAYRPSKLNARGEKELVFELVLHDIYFEKWSDHWQHRQHTYHYPNLMAPGRLLLDITSDYMRLENTAFAENYIIGVI